MRCWESEQDTGWKAEARCRGLDPELFFPQRGASTLQARQVCAGCPVQAQCGEAGLSEYWGIWGGMSNRTRQAIRRERYARAHQSA